MLIIVMLIKKNYCTVCILHSFEVRYNSVLKLRQDKLLSICLDVSDYA